MLISRYSEGASQEEIAFFSDGLGVKLPEQLVLFWEKYNGGETPATRFTSGNVSSDVARFYGLGNVKYPCKKPMYFHHTQYLPIAADSFGNEILINLNTGAIWFQDHETGSITNIAADLRAFIAICQSEEISAASQKSIEAREQELIRKGRGHIITDDLKRMWQMEIDKYADIIREEVSI